MFKSVATLVFSSRTNKINDLDSLDNKKIYYVGEVYFDGSIIDEFLGNISIIKKRAERFLLHCLNEEGFYHIVELPKNEYEYVYREYLDGINMGLTFFNKDDVSEFIKRFNNISALDICELKKVLNINGGSVYSPAYCELFTFEEFVIRITT